MLIVKVDENGKFILPFNLEKGIYMFNIINIDAKTESEFRKLYFFLVETISSHTGYTKNEIHLMFKTENNIPTTKNYSIEDWTNHIEKYKWWVFNTFDICL